MNHIPEQKNSFPPLYVPTESDCRRIRSGNRCIVFARWPVLEPTEGHFDAAAVDALREELMLRSAGGAKPVLCLYAGEDPAWFCAKGGWLQEDNLRCYLRYAGRTARVFGHLTDEYITLFEPNELVWSRSVNRSFLARLRMLSYMACAHVRAVRLVRDTRAQRSLPPTQIGFVLRMRTVSDLRLGLLRGANSVTASLYEVSPMLAMAKGEFLPPLHNALRIRPGEWADFVGVSGSDDAGKRLRCCRAAAALVSAEIREVKDEEPSRAPLKKEG